MTHPAFAVFERVLREQGLREALGTLIAPTDFRYAGVFRFRDELATAAAYYDREQPQIERIDEVPDTDTYCIYVRSGREPFATADAQADTRLTTHPARAHYRTYVGVPILAPEGELLGVLCCYDHQPHDVAQLDLALLAEVASHLAYQQLVPPYPYPPPR